MTELSNDEQLTKPAFTPDPFVCAECGCSRADHVVAINGGCDTEDCPCPGFEPWVHPEWCLLPESHNGKCQRHKGTTLHGTTPTQGSTTNMPAPGSMCPTCEQQVVSSVSWVRHSHEDICAAEQRAWHEGSQQEATWTIAELERMLGACEYPEIHAFLPLLIQRLKDGGHRV